MDDITFCLSECKQTDCFRHPSNIQDRTIPHSYAEFKGTETCPFAKDIYVTINDDTISRKETIDAVHTAMYGFICGAEDGDEMTDADKLVLSINKAVANAIKALPTAQPNLQPTCNQLATDCIDRKAAIDAFEERLKANGYSNVALVSELNRCIGYLMRLPSVQPESTIGQLNADDQSTKTDVISRSAAIDAVNGMPDCPNGYSDTYDKRHIIVVLEDVPSVQPKDYECWGCNCKKMEAQLSKEDATKDATFDCISRRAAINAMWKALHEYEDNTEKQFQESDELDVDDWIVHRGFVQDMNDIDRQTILNLPSVQPEQIARDIATIIENEKDMRVILQNAERTETHSCDCERTDTHEWIPVSEALPEDGVTVWVTIKGHDVIRCEDGETLEQAVARISKMRRVSEGFWCEDDKTWYNAGGYPMMVQPIAWMPIDTPEPWKGR